MAILFNFSFHFDKVCAAVSVSSNKYKLIVYYCNLNKSLIFDSFYYLYEDNDV